MAEVEVKPHHWVECFRCGHKWAKGVQVDPSKADCCRKPLLFLMTSPKHCGAKVSPNE